MNRRAFGQIARQWWLGSVGLLVFVFLGPAQAATCDLQVSVAEYETGKQYRAMYSPPVIDRRPIAGANVTATNLTTKRAFQEEIANAVSTFKRLPVGDYELRVKKPSYQQTVKEIRLDCAPDENVVREYIFLWKGDSKSDKRVTEPVVIFEGTLDGSHPPNPDYGVAGRKKVSIGDTYFECPTGSGRGPAPGSIWDIITFNCFGTNHFTIPKYPADGKFQRASGLVQVQVLVDETGTVNRANAVSGNRALHEACLTAARATMFPPRDYKTTGIIAYYFVP